ncbi:hypothetical protein ZWY2020_045626 [Hordeum vulgare]|nr:hypothetical protein ZWY2020_045626 [Hordeum vulgare]
MAASASASAPPGAPRRRGSADVGAQVEQLCCVCHLPADPVRKLAPLRRGYFVHYDCERSWTDSRDRGRCECKKVFEADVPATIFPYTGFYTTGDVDGAR